MKKISFISLFFILILIPFVHAGGQPMETLKAGIDNAMKILDDPQYKDEAQKKTQRDEIWEIIGRVFDQERIAQITLARNWSRFSQAEQKEFTEVFSRFLGENYVEKIQSGYSGEKVVYLGQENIDDRRSIVKTKIIRAAAEIPIDYRMHKTGAGWRVYDVVIEGVSLVRNYRTQFSDLLQKNKPQELIETIKKRL